MHKRLAGFLLAAAVTGCGPKHASFVKVDNVALGRVVIYRNGVAFYERRTVVEGGQLTVSVPRDRVDDFLKSLTVVDAISREPVPVSIPREQVGDGTNLIMKLQVPTKGRAEVVLTYVTEAPAWKPSYRVVVGDHKDVMLEGWATIDNTSGEDWRDVLVGVGSSSALSFRYDLWSVRNVQRDTLAAEEKFAIAPPSGVSPYAGGKAGDAAGEAVLGELIDDEIRRPHGHPEAAEDASSRFAALTEREERAERGGAESVTVTGGRGLARGRDDDGDDEPAPAHRAKAARPVIGKAGPAAPPASARVAGGDRKMKDVSQALVRSDKTIVVESFANAASPDAQRRALDRANIVRNQLIDQGVAPGRIQVATKVAERQPERVRLVAQAAKADEGKARTGAHAPDLAAAPVGESHFESGRPMTVERGSSAMVSMVKKPTQGEVVYLYDAESERGNASFAFRAVRFINPTESTLETGPVTVYGQERFIGEGLTEPVPPRAPAVVPFALDRQIVVERGGGDEDKLARLISLNRGVLTAEVQHIRRQKLTLTNRLDQLAKVYLRHTVTKGWTLVDAPPAFERVGEAHLFEVQLRPHEVKEVMIAEATPIQRTLDLGADVTLEMMRVWVDAPEGSAELKDGLRKLLGLHKTLVDLAQEQDSLRRRLADYKARMDELHMQILSLQAVKTGNDLMGHLKGKMKDISDRVQKTTIQVVDQEEKIMLARVRFQDAIGELALPDVTQPARPGPAAALKTAGGAGAAGHR